MTLRLTRSFVFASVLPLEGSVVEAGVPRLFLAEMFIYRIVGKEGAANREMVRNTGMDGQELFELAMKHIYGDGVPEDNDLAVKLLTQAHAMGHIEATYNLGICYHYGFGTSVDLKKAFELYLESANAGYGKGMELVGRFYNRGIYVNYDRRQAEHWLLQAMESSDSDAVEEAKKELSFGE